MARQKSVSSRSRRGSSHTSKRREGNDSPENDFKIIAAQFAKAEAEAAKKTPVTRRPSSLMSTVGNSSDNTSNRTDELRRSGDSTDMLMSQTHWSELVRLMRESREEQVAQRQRLARLEEAIKAVSETDQSARHSGADGPTNASRV